MKKILLALVIVVLTMGMVFAAGSAEKEVAPAEGSSEKLVPSQADKVLIVAVPANFEEKWNPVLAESAYDQEVMDQIFTAPCRLNADNEMVPWAGSIDFEKTSDGGVLYTVHCKEGMVYSDGVPVTIDDLIYYYYIVSDPSYTGPSSTFIQNDIEGIKEYYYNNPNYSQVAKIAQEKYSYENISREDALTYLNASDLDGWYNNDPFGEAWGGETWENYIDDSGYTAQKADYDLTDNDQMRELLAIIEYETCFDAYGDQSLVYWTGVVNESLKTGEDITEISGIKKIDDYTCTVKFNSVNIYGDREISGYYIPSHYYGELVKGHVEPIMQNMVPLGSGPYAWKSYGDNIVTLTANTLYFEGVPNIGTIKYQYVPESDLIASLSSGVIDIATPSGNKDNLEEVEALGLAYDLTPTAGYGYCGFNADNLPLNVRKGLFCLMSNRKPAVQGYYGDIADVIERPMPSVLYEYPKEAEQYYPYDKKVALGYFNKAGYEMKNGVLVNDKGEKLVVNAYIGGDGVGNHPTFPMLVQAGEDLRSLGGELQIQDVPFNVLQSAMNDGTADIFCLAWGNVNTCDKRSQFYTDGGQNRYNVSDKNMDALLDEIVITVDPEERKVLVSDMLDLAMDLCMELPIYQRKDMIAYNGDNLDLDTLPEKSTAFWQYKNQMWKLKMN